MSAAQLMAACETALRSGRPDQFAAVAAETFDRIRYERDDARLDWYLSARDAGGMHALRATAAVFKAMVKDATGAVVHPIGPVRRALEATYGPGRNDIGPKPAYALAADV